MQTNRGARLGVSARLAVIAEIRYTVTPGTAIPAKVLLIMPAGSSGKLLLTPYAMVRQTVSCPVPHRPQYGAVRNLTLIYSAFGTNADRLRTAPTTLGVLFTGSQDPGGIATNCLN